MRIRLPTKLSWYFIRQYSFNFLALLLGLLAIIYVFDIVELLRRASKSDQVGLPLVLQMGLYKLPEVGQLVVPFAILFSAMWTFWQLTKRHELTVARSAGVSAWQFILPLVLTAFFIGVVLISTVNPLSALFIAKFEKLEMRHLNSKSRAVSLSDQGLWLKQKHGEEQAILHAQKVQMPHWHLQQVTVFFFDLENNFTRRVDAASSYLKDNKWHFQYAVSNAPGALPKTANDLKIETDLTLSDLESSFASPETISFWKLADYIETVEETGFDSTPVKMYFHSLLSQPLLYMAMILLAAAVSLRPQRMQGGAYLILAGIVIGFTMFFMSSFMQALGASGQIPIFVAAWFPAMIGLLFGIGAMMVLEDG
jgi:lipopolysaccharide export system permease protein